MPTWREYQVHQEHLKDVRRTAAESRLARSAGAQQLLRRHLGAAAIRQLGHWLVTVGRHLQRQHSPAV